MEVERNGEHEEEKWRKWRSSIGVVTSFTGQMPALLPLMPKFHSSPTEMLGYTYILAYGVCAY